MIDRMIGAVLPGNRRVELRDFPVPKPGPGQVLVRMRASALCGSDLRAIYRPTQQGTGPEAYRGVIAGHEPCGEIVGVGSDVRRFAAGDRVIIYHIAGCGVCPDCRSGWMISCHSPLRAAYGWQRDGGHAEFLVAEERTLVPLPEPLTYLDGAIVACGLGTVYAAALRARVSGRDRVLITGLGPVGLGAILLCQALGADVIGVEANPARVELARSLGLKMVIKPTDSSARDLLDQTGGHGFEVAIDCSGNETARRLCLEAAREWGRVVFVGEGGTASIEPSPLLIHKQLTLHGSWVCSIGQMEELVELLVRWKLHPERIVSHRFPLDQVKAAYETFDRGDTGKVAITWEN